MKSPPIACLIAAALLSPGERFELRCEPEQELTRSFLYRQELSLAEMIIAVDGEEMPPMPGGEMEQEQSRELRLEVRDRVVSVDGGRATVFERSYDRIAGSRSTRLTDPLGEEHGGEAEESSELEGLTVRFEGQDGEFAATFAEGESGEEAWLEGLEALLDLEQLLPAEEVEPGDTWSIDPSLLTVLRRPGGDLHLDAEWAGEAAVLGSGEGREDRDEPELEGEGQAEFRGVVERDGLRLAEVQLELEAFTVLDLTEEFASVGEELPDDLPPGMVMPEMESVVHETEVSAEGTLLWDLEAGRLHSLALECELIQTQTMVMFMAMGPTEQEMEQVTVMEGTETYEVSFAE